MWTERASRSWSNRSISRWVHDQGGGLALGPQVLARPAVESDRVGLGPLVEGADAVVELHRHQPLRVPAVHPPFRIPGLGVDGAAVGSAHVGEDVEVMDRSLDHQRVLHLVAKRRAPVAELPHVAGEAHDQVVDGAAARPERLAQGGLVLVEAVAHGDAHLLPGPPHLFGDAARPQERVGDRFLRQDVHAVRQGGIDDVLVKGGRHDDGAEVGFVLREGSPKVGVTLFPGQTEMGLRVHQGVGIGVDGGDHLDQPVLDVGTKDVIAPGAAAPAGANLDHSVCHGSPSRIRCIGARRIAPDTVHGQGLRPDRLRCRAGRTPVAGGLPVPSIMGLVQPTRPHPLQPTIKLRREAR